MSLVLLNELPNCKRILKSWSSGFNIRLQLGNSFSNTKLTHDLEVLIFVYN